MIRKPAVIEGWITVPFDGHDLSRIFIAVGQDAPMDWKGAFLGWKKGKRVAMVRPPGVSGRYRVWVRIDGAVEALGTIDL